MRKFEALAAISIPVLVSVLVGCTTGVAAGIPDSAPSEETSATPSKDKGGSTNEETTSKGPTWTFFIYAQGDNARSPALAADLAKIKSAKLGANVTVVVLADWNAGMVDADAKPLFITGTEQYTFGGGKSPTVKHEVEQDFDDPMVMTKAIAQTFRDHPADHRGLIIWSRGDSDSSNHVLGADVQDTARPDAKGMTVDAMRNAIKDGIDGAGLTGDRPLDVLGFDLSSAGRIEDAYAMKSLAKVYVSNASQDGNASWAYADAFGFLGSSSSKATTAEDFVKFEAKAWQTDAAANGTLPRAHVAIDTTKLDNVARATDSVVLAVGSTRSALPRVASAAAFATIDAGESGRRPDYARFMATLADGPNMGIVTTAAQNAFETFSNAFIGTSNGSAGFSIALPTTQTITNQWYNDYLSTSTDWYRASRWNHLLALWSSAHDQTIPAFEASIMDDPESAPGGAMIRVGTSSNDGSMKADLFMQNGNAKIFYGDVVASNFQGGEAMVWWTKRIGAVANQPARAISIQTFAGKRTALAGRVTLGQRQIDSAVIVSGVATSNVFMLNVDREGSPMTTVNAAELLMIDPSATFTPSVTRIEGEASPAVYGSPVAITKAGVLMGSVAMTPGSYELRVDVRNIWNLGGFATQSFSIAPF